MTTSICFIFLFAGFRAFSSSFNQSQHSSAVEITEKGCNWLKDEQKVTIFVVRQKSRYSRLTLLDDRSIIRKDNNKTCWVLFLGFFFFFYITPTGQEMAIFHLCALSRRHYFFFFFDHQCSGGFKNNFCCCKTYQPKSDSLITIKAIRNRLMTSY